MESLFENKLTSCLLVKFVYIEQRGHPALVKQFLSIIANALALIDLGLACFGLFARDLSLLERLVGQIGWRRGTHAETGQGDRLGRHSRRCLLLGRLKILESLVVCVLGLFERRKGVLQLGLVLGSLCNELEKKKENNRWAKNTPSYLPLSWSRRCP